MKLIHRSPRRVEVEVGDKPLEHYANQSFLPTFIPIVHPSQYACILRSTVSLGPTGQSYFVPKRRCAHMRTLHGTR